MSDVAQRTLDMLKDEPLTMVTFVLDYVQLNFGQNLINALVWPEVVLTARVYTKESVGYRDALCALITHRVRDFQVHLNSSVNIEFEPEGVIRISLRPEDSVGPEAINFIGRDLLWV